MQKTPTILGISPGTRSIGLAVYRNGSLAEWRVKSFKSSWSHSKLKSIVYELKNYMSIHEISMVGIKKPDQFRSSTGVQKVVSEIAVHAKRNGIKVAMFSLPELKRHFSKDKGFTKEEMIRQVAQANVELHFEYNKEQKNRNSYYAKMFEAIAVASIQVN